MPTKVTFTDMRYYGCQFTWTNKHEDGTRIFSKLDRVLVNELWVDRFPDAETKFIEERLSDHCPALVSFPCVQRMGTPCFKFFKMWIRNEGFTLCLQQGWTTQVTGYKMSVLVHKLKNMKQHLRPLNKREYADTEQRALVALRRCYRSRKQSI